MADVGNSLAGVIYKIPASIDPTLPYKVIETTDQSTAAVYEVEFQVPGGCYPYIRDTVATTTISGTDGSKCTHDFGSIMHNQQTNSACWDTGFNGGVYSACSADDESVGVKVTDVTLLSVSSISANALAVDFVQRNSILTWTNHCLCLQKADSTLHCTDPFTISNECLEICIFDSAVVIPNFQIARGLAYDIDLAALRTSVSASPTCLDGTYTYQIEDSGGANQNCVTDCPAESISGDILSLTYPADGNF